MLGPNLEFNPCKDYTLNLSAARESKVILAFTGGITVVEVEYDITDQILYSEIALNAPLCNLIYDLLIDQSSSLNREHLLVGDLTLAGVFVIHVIYTMAGGCLCQQLTHRIQLL